MDFNKLRKWLAIFSIVIIIGWLLIINYSDLRWETNKAGYLGIGSMLLLFFANFKYIKTTNIK